MLSVKAPSKIVGCKGEGGVISQTVATCETTFGD